MGVPEDLGVDLIAFLKKRRVPPRHAIVALLTTAISGLQYNRLTLEQAHIMFDTIWRKMQLGKADYEARDRKH